MKNLILLVGFVFSLGVVIAQDNEGDSKPGPRMKFKAEKHEFGDIHQGDKVEHIFEFENTGTEPLILTDVRSTCGCTIPKWPREPIPPGQKNKITVRFNSAGKMGKVTKVVKIVSNSVDPINQVTITTNILPKKEGS